MELAQGSGDLWCHGLVGHQNRIRIFDPNHMSCVTSPVTQKLHGPSTAKDFRNYKWCYGILSLSFSLQL